MVRTWVLLLFLYWQSWTVGPPLCRMFETCHFEGHTLLICWSWIHVPWIAPFSTSQTRLFVSVSFASVWICLLPFTHFFGFVFRFLPNSSTTLNRTCIQLHETTCFRMTSLVRPRLRKHNRTFETYTLLSFFALPTFLKVCLWPSNRSSARRRSGLDLLQILECYMARPYTVFLKTHRLWSWGSLLAATGFRTLLSSAFPDNLENRQSTFQAYLRITFGRLSFCSVCWSWESWVSPSEPRTLRTAPLSPRRQIPL